KAFHGRNRDARDSRHPPRVRDRFGRPGARHRAVSVTKPCRKTPPSFLAPACRHPELQMARAPRDFYAGGYYHVNTRGNNKAQVYVDSTDRLVFLEMLERSQLKYEWIGA